MPFDWHHFVITFLAWIDRSLRVMAIVKSSTKPQPLLISSGQSLMETRSSERPRKEAFVTPLVTRRKIDTVP